MNVLVIVEHDNKQLKPATLNVISAAKVFNDTCTAIVLGHECESVIEEASSVEGVQTVFYAEHERFKASVAEDLCAVLLPLADDYDVILGPATTYGKNLLPRLAAQLDLAQYSDVIKIIDAETFERPIYAGNVIQTVKALDNKKILTIRPTAFESSMVSEHNKAEVINIESRFENTFSTYISRQETESTRPELTDARVVVSGGRALGSAEKFTLIESLADSLNAAVGASRAAVDAGFVANDYQVGQTGKVVAPELYIAIGISGAIQHLAGMKDSKVIVAINKDEDAPIFQIATYGVVGDLFQLVPELIEKLKE